MSGFGDIGGSLAGPSAGGGDSRLAEAAVKEKRTKDAAKKAKKKKLGAATLAGEAEKKKLADSTIGRASRTSAPGARLGGEPITSRRRLST